MFWTDLFFLDDGGVFKAKDTNKHTKGAREVGETKDTRTDLPIDQVPAEEVKVSQPQGHPLTHWPVLIYWSTKKIFLFDAN